MIFTIRKVSTCRNKVEFFDKADRGERTADAPLLSQIFNVG